MRPWIVCCCWRSPPRGMGNRAEAALPLGATGAVLANAPSRRTGPFVLPAGRSPVPGRARPGPLLLADTTLLLPTRRATRALQEAFLAAAGGTALLLPRIRPIIGAAEEDLGALASAEDLATDDACELRPAISAMGR